MENRMLMRYSFFQVDPAWRRLPDEERAMNKKEIAEVVAAAGIQVYPYSTVGLREDADFVFWQVSDSPEGIMAFQAALNGTALGRWLNPTYSYLAMTRKSAYLKGHKHEGQES